MKATKFLRAMFYITLGALLASAVFVFWPQPINTKEQARSVHAKSRRVARNLSLDLEIYLSANDRLPEADSWLTAMVYGSDKEVRNLSVPANRSHDGKQYFFSFFEPLSGVEVATVLNPETVPLFFETGEDVLKFACGLERIAWPHSGSVVVVFLDGHVESMPDAWQLETVKIEFAPAEE